MIRTDHIISINEMRICNNKTIFSKKLSIFIWIIIFGLSICTLSSIDIVLASTSNDEDDNGDNGDDGDESDNSGDNGDELPSATDKKVALVLPVFTWAAYQNGSFYNFYELYSYIQFANRQVNISVTNNTDLLKDRPMINGPSLFVHSTPDQKPFIPYLDYIMLVSNLLKEQNIPAVNITDFDVHNGIIFNRDGTNAYDVLFLFHNEYVTQTEYDNLKRFVANGGTIVFGDANVLYAEVAYNEKNNTITLVSGHNWNFDNKTTAWVGPAERWPDETREWVGSNFLDIPSNYPLGFANNPFNYTHSEENYVANLNAKILIDYGLYNVPPSSGEYLGAIVATYEMNFGKGKIIHTGIWGHNLVVPGVNYNQAFVDYFKNIIIPLSIDKISYESAAKYFG
ncbi:MAG TPA: N,N-dimethylformamidase beta subunit family domain-containing protein [Candidatus Nitrosocosmicus sp.]|nr:N,N-dimethylformamidase beta subunit family domain-containing protein [Candidatus Nitrosocosmicus sp.]